jgi:two-component system sensor histidine kinase UhpB
MMEKLQRTNERYELVNQATNDTIWEWDLLKNKTYWGEGISKVFGFLKKEVITDSDWAWNNIHPEEKARVESKVRQHIVERKLHYQDDFRYRCADGSFKNVYAKGYLLLDNLNNPFKMIGAMVDVTDKVRLEEELTEQKLLIQKKLTEATIQAQEAEREELGRELHDNINQILASSKMYLNLGSANAGIREEMIVKSTEHINHAIEEIRKLSKSLIVPSLGEMGLKELITDLINNISATTGIRTNVTFSNFDENLIEKKVKLMLFRIVQEQCNNVLKHAKAKNLVLALRRNQHTVLLEISDDGVGLNTKSKSNGIGLTNIKSRIDVYAGKMEINSSPGNGCQLLLEIPVFDSKEEKFMDPLGPSIN